MQVAVGLVGGGGSTDYTCFMTMHAGLCGPGGRWWKHTAGFYDYAYLQADCLESGFSSGPLRSIASMVTFFIQRLVTSYHFSLLEGFNLSAATSAVQLLVIYYC